MAQAQTLRTLPPSSNWYCSHVSDFRWLKKKNWGMYVFAAKGNIVIMKIPSTQERDEYPSVQREIARGRAQRIVALSILNDRSVVCGDGDGLVQIWDIYSLKLQEGHEKHGSAIVQAIAVSETPTTLIVSGDNKGVICAWSRDKGHIFRSYPIKGDSIFVMGCSFTDPTQVGVGYRSGKVAIIDSMTGEVQTILRGHDEEVHSLAWKDVSSPTQLLATSSRDRTIKVWSIPSGELLKELHLPTKRSAETYKPDRSWIPISWVPSHWDDENLHKLPSQKDHLRLLSGSATGQIYLWQFADKQESKAAVNPIAFTKGHLRPIFNITCASSEDMEKPSYQIITTSMDREIRSWDMDTRRCTSMIPTFGGFVYSVRVSPTNPNTILAGVGDNTIRVWRLDNAKDPYDGDTIWKGIQSKVTCVRWHPHETGVFVYGTEEGRIGVVNTLSKEYKQMFCHHKGAPVVDIGFRSVDFEHLNKMQGSMQETDNDEASDLLRQVQELTLAKERGEKIQGLLNSKHTHSKAARSNILWSLSGDGRLYESNMQQPERPGTDLVKCFNRVHKDSPVFKSGVDLKAFSISADENLVAFGFSDGAVTICDASRGWPKLILCQKHLKTITTLEWEPMSADTVEKSIRLASGSFDNSVMLYEFDVEKLRQGGDCPQVEAIQLKGHTSGIVDLRWGPEKEKPSLIASSSYDGTVQIWDTVAAVGISNYRGHSGRVLSADWCCIPEHPDRLVSAGEDQTIRVWKHIPQAPNYPPSTKSKGKKKPRVNENILCTDAETFTSNAQPGPVSNALKKRKNAKPSTDRLFHNVKKVSLDQALSSCESILEPTHSSTAESDIPFQTRLLSSDESGECLLSEKIDEFEEEQDIESCARLLMFEGRVVEALRMILKYDMCTPEWVSIAPMAGLNVWKEVVQAHSTQLKEQGKYKEAVTYLLSIGYHRKAIKCLIECHQYEEALTLAKVRLLDTDPLMEEILIAWAEYLQQGNELPFAARVFVAANRVELAVNILARTRNLRAMQVGLEFATKYKLPIIPSLSATVTDFAVQEREWEVARNTLGNFSVHYKAQRVYIEAADIVSKLFQQQIFALSPQGVHEEAGNIWEVDFPVEKHDIAYFWSSARNSIKSSDHAFGELELQIRSKVHSASSMDILWKELRKQINFSDIISVQDLADIEVSLRDPQFKKWYSSDKTRFGDIVALVARSVVELMQGYLVSALELWNEIFEVCSEADEFQWLARIAFLLFPREISTTCSEGDYVEPEETLELLTTLQCWRMVGLLQAYFDTVGQELEGASPFAGECADELVDTLQSVYVSAGSCAYPVLYRTLLRVLETSEQNLAQEILNRIQEKLQDLQT